jgi:hypothetical protein
MMAAAEPPEVPRTTILQIFEITASHVSKSPKRRPNEKPRKTKLRKSKEVVLL